MLPMPDVFSPQFYELNMIYGRQQAALIQNKNNKENYINQSKVWIGANTDNFLAARPLTVKPLLPKELIVNDDGTEDYKAFSDLKEPELPANLVIIKNPQGPGLFGSAPPPDKQDMIIAMLRSLNDKLERLLTK